MTDAGTSASAETGSTGSPQKTKIGLVLQGGGALGAYEAGAVKCLYDNGMECTIIAGASSGAANAVTLAAAKTYPPDELEAMWRGFKTPEILVPPPIGPSERWRHWQSRTCTGRGWTTGAFRPGHTRPTTHRSRRRWNAWTGIRCAIRTTCGCSCRRATTT